MHFKTKRNDYKAWQMNAHFLLVPTPSSAPVPPTNPFSWFLPPFYRVFIPFLLGSTPFLLGSSTIFYWFPTPFSLQFPPLLFLLSTPFPPWATTHFTPGFLSIFPWVSAPFILASRSLFPISPTIQDNISDWVQVKWIWKKVETIRSAIRIQVVLHHYWILRLVFVHSFHIVSYWIKVLCKKPCMF